jgi:hypothetical protein
MKKLDIPKRFLKLAYTQLYPDLTTIDGLEQALINWYCFQYNVPPNDDKLMDMTLEELLVLRQMHRLKENPHLADELNSDYEEWLKKEMGDDYVSEEAMIAKAEELEKEDAKAAEELSKILPDKITTDFSNVGTEE